MKKALSLFLLFIFTWQSYAQETFPDSTRTKAEVNRNKLIIIGGASVVALSSSYIYLQTVWWADQKKAFHIDHDMDYRYAKNMDKAAHFVGGVMSAELFKAGFYWSGVKAKPSYLYAGALGSAMQIMIELKDAYAPTYGFSLGDVAAGSVGSFIPYLKYNFPKLHALNIKLSYYRHHNYYYNVSPKADLVDDYMNQTYWIALSVNDWLPKGSKMERIWPDFLCIAGGWGVDERLNYYYTGQSLAENKGKGKYEYYVSLDIDWRKIIPQNSNFTKALSDALNYIKLPLPALRLGPSVQGYWFYL